MLVPWRNRSTYLPRTPPRESYSGRRSSPESEGLLVFFIVLALAARGRSCTNDPNLITVFCMRNYQKTSCRALTQQEPSLLTDRVFWISDGDRQRIAEITARQLQALVRRTLNGLAEQSRSHR